MYHRESSSWFYFAWAFRLMKIFWIDAYHTVPDKTPYAHITVIKQSMINSKVAMTGFKISFTLSNKMATLSISKSILIKRKVTKKSQNLQSTLPLLMILCNLWASWYDLFIRYGAPRGKYISIDPLCFITAIWRYVDFTMQINGLFMC